MLSSALRRLRRHYETRSRGQSLVEFALILPVFMVFFATTLDLGRLAISQTSLANAAREGSFQASKTPASFDNTKGCTDGKSNLVVCRVLLEASGSGVAVAPGDITMSCSPSGCATGLGNHVTVSVVGHFQLLTPLLAMFFNNSQAITFTKSATSQIETLPVPSSGPPAATPSPTPSPSPSASASASPTPSPTPACTVPSAGFTYTTLPANMKAPVTVTVTDTTTSPSCAITSWFWTWGDNTTSLDKDPQPHSYLVAGTYEIHLTVANAAGTNTTGTIQIKVKQP